ncbi:hypothetical protein [Microbacterium paraoxydans]|uniref:hypothetical protein n=1 Tax=Microbacterium paraoxydans TaxID=199592 RepID=UPI003D72BBAF
MDRLISEVRASLEAGMFLLALQGSLALVDICGGLSAADGVASGANFRRWFKSNPGKAYPRISPDDVWHLRCGILHQGRAKSKNYDALFFTLPDGRGNTVREAYLNNAVSLDLVMFCTVVLDAVDSWWRRSQLDSPVRENAQHVVQVRPDGLPPYILGLPVLG